MGVGGLLAAVLLVVGTLWMTGPSSEAGGAEPDEEVAETEPDEEGRADAPHVGGREVRPDF